MKDRRIFNLLQVGESCQGSSWKFSNVKVGSILLLKMIDTNFKMSITKTNFLFLLSLFSIRLVFNLSGLYLIIVMVFLCLVRVPSLVYVSSIGKYWFCQGI